MSWIRARRGMIGEGERKWDVIWIPELYSNRLSIVVIFYRGRVCTNMKRHVKMPTSRAF